MSRKHFIFMGALAFFCLTILPMDSWGYAYLSKSRWPRTKMPIPWYMTYSEASNWRGRSKEQLEKMVKKAFGLWEDIDCSFMSFRYMGVTPTGSNKGDGLNTIEWVAKLPEGASASAIGLGGPLASGGRIHEGNVWIKAMERSDDFIGIVIAHEVGHAIALGHTDVRPSIMYPSSSGGTRLTQDDKDGLCNAYPASANSCSEDSNCPTGMVCKEQVCAKCSSDTDCGDDKYCDNELCVSKCKTDSDCEPKGRLCVASKCKNCADDKECGETRFCKDQLCQDKCKTDEDCSGDETCRENGRCIKRGGCVSNADCKSDEFCQNEQCISKGALGKACASASVCDADQDCLPHICTVDLDCNEGFTCKLDGKDGTCVDKDGGSASVCGSKCSGKSAIVCPTGFVCKEFTPGNSYCYMETRVPAPAKPEPGDNTGAGCSSLPAGQASSFGFGNGLLAFLALFWLLGLRRRT